MQEMVSIEEDLVQIKIILVLQIIVFNNILKNFIFLFLINKHLNFKKYFYLISFQIYLIFTTSQLLK